MPEARKRARKLGTPPQQPSLPEPWNGIWKLAHKDMVESGVWSPAMQPLLDEYATALHLADRHRRMAEIDPVETNRESGLTHMHAGFASADRELKRAAMLADLLGLTARAKKALKLAAEEAQEVSPAFQRADELAQRRAAKG